MIRLLLQNLRIRLLEWLRKPKKQDVPKWTLKEIQALDADPDGDGKALADGYRLVARRPLW